MAMLEADRKRVAEILAFYPMVTPGSWAWALIERVAGASMRIEEADRMEANLLDRERARARSEWLERHAAEIRHLVEELPKDPPKISPRIESTYFGARWKLASWDELASMLQDHGDWSQSSETLAWNLVGLRPPRNHPPIHPQTLRAHREAVIERERERLSKLAEETLRPRYDRDVLEAERSAEASPLLKKVRTDRGRAWDELKAACQLLPRATVPGKAAGKSQPSRGRANPIIPCHEPD